MRSPDDALTGELRERGYAVVPGWLSASQVEELQASFSELPFQDAKVGRAQGAVRDSDIRGDRTSWLPAGGWPGQLAQVEARLESLRLRLNRELFLGLQEFEAHLAAYPPGAFYRRHLDRHRDESRRTVSLILYLNPAWEEQDGGELVLYQNEAELCRVLPYGGTLACFISAEFPHEVLPARRERRSLTGWFLQGGARVPIV